MSFVSEKWPLAGFVAMSLYISAPLAETLNPHLVQKSLPQVECTSCHINQPQIKDDALLITRNHAVDLTEFKQGGVEMCSMCHSPNQEHKMIGLAVDFSVPADMPLGEEHDITCLTCHYTHGSLSSETPQTSVSFLDHLFKSERLTKSYLLRRNNVNGELCLTCHNPSRGSK